MAANYLRGAFVSFTPTFLFSTPNTIVFQFNPEKMTHSWSEPRNDSADKTAALSVKGDPEESFSFTLALDAGEIIADSKPTAPIALLTGISSRLAALEALQFPIDQGMSGKPCLKLPLVLFAWGLGRIAPVRITRLSVSETEYDRWLNPTKAEVEIELHVLRKDEIKALPEDRQRMATAVMNYTEKVRKGLVAANVANAVEGTIGMLPF